MVPSILCYLSDRIAVMSSPFINDQLPTVRKYLCDHLKECVKIVDVEDEQNYRLGEELPNVSLHPMGQQAPLPLEELISIAASVESFLTTHDQGHVLLHSRYGDTKSCFLAAICLLHCGLRKSAFETINFVNAQKKHNVFGCPSLVRYVYYYERLLRRDRISHKAFSLLTCRIRTIPRCSSSIINSSCSPAVVVEHLGDASSSPVMFQLQANGIYSESSCKDIDFSIPKEGQLRGDIMLSCFSDNELIFKVCFHTAFVEQGYLRFQKSNVDIACDDVHHRMFSKEFELELVLKQITDNAMRSQD